MRIRIGDTYADVPEELNLQFTKKNILFAFDEIECERSTSFSLPATEHNATILQLAGEEHTTGGGMRVRYDAVVEVDSVQKTGYLYTTEFDRVKREYKCVFVCGELLELQRIKNAGKLPELDLFAGADILAKIGDGSGTQNTYFGTRAYYQNYAADYVPAIRLSHLLDKAAEKLNITISGTPFGNEGVLKGGMKTPQGLLSLAQTNGEQGWGYNPIHPTTAINMLTATSDYAMPLAPIRFTTILGEHMDYVSPEDPGTYRTFAVVRQYMFAQKTTIAFPDDTPIDVYLVSFPRDADDDTPVSQQNALGDFLGDYSFTKQDNIVTRVGMPLAGREIEIPANVPFMVLRDGWFVNYTNAGGYNVMGWMPDGTARNYSQSVQVIARDAEAGDLVALSNNLPDITVIDLMKIAAAYSGKQLYYDDTNGLQLDTLAFDTWNVQDYSTRIIAVQQLQRTVGKNAQHNYIKFADDSSLLASDLRQVDYQISNANIDTKKTLYTIPFSGGGSRGAAYLATSQFILRNSADNPFPQMDTAVIIAAPLIRRLLQLQTIGTDGGYTNICTASTLVKMQIQMPMMEFNNLQAKVLIYVRGVRYVWTEAQWSKGVATIFLQKIT